MGEKATVSVPNMTVSDVSDHYPVTRRFPITARRSCVVVERESNTVLIELLTS